MISRRLVYLSARLIAGRWFWIVPAVPLVWIAFLMIRLLVGWRLEEYLPHQAHTVIGLPLTVLAIGLGVRIIAGDIDRRTLEIAYTVPGGSHRVWLAKLVAAAAMLVVSEVLLATATAVFLTGFPLRLLYGPLQSAMVYAALAMALSALFKSEVTGALATVPFLVLGLASSSTRGSPLYATVRPGTQDRVDSADLLAMAVQNRIGYLLVFLALVGLAFSRAERREKMTAG